MSTRHAADQRAAAAVVAHHTELSDTLARHVAGVLEAVERNDQPQHHRDELVTWLHRELLPHAKAEETTLYAAAAAIPECALLVTGMRDEHHVIAELVEELSMATSPVQIAAAARALSAVLTSHLAKENDLIVPRLVEDEHVSLADLLAGMHELVGSHPTSERPGSGSDAGCGYGDCGCSG